MRSESIDPFFQDRLERAKQHRVIARIEKEQLPKGEIESNKDIPNPILEGTIEEYGWSAKAVDNLIDAASKGYIKITRKDEENIRIEFFPITVLPEELGHVTEFQALRKNIARRQPVFGTIEPRVLTYLQTIDFAVEGYMDDEQDGKDYARLYVNSSELQRTRNIYLDPESLAVTDYEYGYAFSLYGGVPFSAINRVEVIRAKEMAYRPSNEPWEDKDSNAVEQEMERQTARLREFVEQLK